MNVKTYLNKELELVFIDVSSTLLIELGYLSLVCLRDVKDSSTSIWAGVVS